MILIEFIKQGVFGGCVRRWELKKVNSQGEFIDMSSWMYICVLYVRVRKGFSLYFHGNNYTHLTNKVKKRHTNHKMIADIIRQGVTCHDFLNLFSLQFMSEILPPLDTHNYFTHCVPLRSIYSARSTRYEKYNDLQKPFFPSFCIFQRIIQMKERK